jgi:hypothetical protein
MNELLTFALRELKSHGIKPQHRSLGSGHMEIAWQATPDKEPRRIVLASTSSDWRARTNVRAEIRRFLRADNVSLKPVQKPQRKPQSAPKLEEALELPPAEGLSTDDRIDALSQEIADLSQLVLRLTKAVKNLLQAAPVKAPPRKPGRPPRRNATAHLRETILNLERRRH